MTTIPVVDISFLFFIDARYPALDVDVGHFLSSDGLLLQDNVDRVPDDNPQYITETES